MGAQRDLLGDLGQRVAALGLGRDERELMRDLATRLGLEARSDPDGDPGPDDDDDLGLADVPPTVSIDREFRATQ
jgi:hypothetical protein